MTGSRFVWPRRNPRKGAWFGSPELKAWVFAKMVEHRRQDEIIKGDYQVRAEDTGAGYKGCLVGCTLPRLKKKENAGSYRFPGGIVVRSAGNWHMDLEKAYGIPWQVAVLLDDTFEEQGFDFAADFAVESIEAIPVGMVYDQDVLDELGDWCPTSAAAVLEFLKTGVTV